MTPIRVLIIEDVDTMRALLEHVVGGIAGVQVSGVAASGWQARVELTRRRPDLILLDEILPGESSVDLLRDYRAQGIPVILLTGLSDPRHAIGEGAAARLNKPTWETVPADRYRFEQAIRNAVAR